MKEFLLFSKEKREEIIRKIKEALIEDENIIFAYVFGSFVGIHSFRDIDIGIYLKNIKKEEIFDYEFNISIKLSKKVGLSFNLFDIKVLNYVKNSFLNSVFKEGIILFSRDYDLLTDLIEKSSLDSILNESISLQSLKELINKG